MIKDSAFAKYPWASAPTVRSAVGGLARGRAPGLSSAERPRRAGITGPEAIAWACADAAIAAGTSGGRGAGTGSGAAYRSIKTALDALTVFYAQALAHDGFKVNALAPGLRATTGCWPAPRSGNR